MEIIRGNDNMVMTLLGEPPVLKGKEYRIINTLVSVPKDNGIVMLNGLTRSIVFLTNEELEELGDINKYEFLYKSYFFVPKDFDERTVIDMIRQDRRKPIDDVYLNHPESFLVLTTTKCNARCFYCYEMNSKNKHHMTLETAQKVAEYIHKVAPLNKKINISWFGGEPLYNAKVIDIVDNYLRDHGRNFTNTMTSNGYLFDHDLAVKAKFSWHLVDVQITIDGTEEIYNNTKKYIYKDPISPYKKVLKSIEELLEQKISVNVRFNVDLYNAENIKLVIKELHERFGNNPNLGMYLWPIFEEGDYFRTDEQNKELFSKIYEIYDVMDQYGYGIAQIPKSNLEIYNCMADCGTTVTIDVDGNFGTCEHYIDSKFWGHIDNPLDKNMEVLNTWRNYEDRIPECKDCRVYGDCVRPSECIEMRKCNALIKEWKTYKWTKGLEKIYNDYRKRNPIK